MAPRPGTPQEVAALAQMGLRIRDHRKRKGLSVQALANDARLSFQHLHALERGENLPRKETLAKLAKVLGVSLRSLSQGLEALR